MVQDRTDLAVSWLESNGQRLLAQHTLELAQRPTPPTLNEWVRLTTAEREVAAVFEGIDPSVRCSLGAEEAAPLHLYLSTHPNPPRSALTDLLAALTERSSIRVTIGLPAHALPAAIRITSSYDGDVELCPHTLLVTLYPGLTHVHILVHIPESIPLHTPGLQEIAYTLVERLLGEHATQESIGAIEIAPIGARIRDLMQHPFLELPQLVPIASATIRNRYHCALQARTLTDLHLGELAETVDSIVTIPPGCSSADHTLLRVAWWSPRPSDPPSFKGLLEATVALNTQTVPPVLGDGRVYEMVGRLDSYLRDHERRGLVCAIIETISETGGIIIDMAGWYPMALEQMVEVATALCEDNLTASAEALLQLTMQLAVADEPLVSRIQLLLLITSQLSGNEPLAEAAIDWLQTHGRDEELHQLHEIRGLHQEHVANFSSALEEYETALTYPEINTAICRYHMARCHINLGDSDAAIALLQQSFSEAPLLQERFLQDPAFFLYRGEPAFGPLLTTVKGSMM